MTRIEIAAIELHKVLHDNVGLTADYPIAIRCDEDIREQFVGALNKLRLAIEQAETPA